MDPKDIRNLQEAYIGVYDDDIREKLEFETWVNNLLEEGYDLSDYNWDEMYEIYNEDYKGGPAFGMKYSKPKPLSGEKGDGSGYGGDEKFTKPDDKIEKPGTTVPPIKKGGYGRIMSNIPHGIGDHRDKIQSRISTITGKDPGAPTSQKMAPKEKKKNLEIIRKKKIQDSYDLYDTILSHLIDEGYADTYEAAESIMVNMSEDWRDSIVEEKKPLPIGKMKKKEMELMSKADKALGPALRTPMNSPERNAALRTSERGSNISDVRRSVSTRGGKMKFPMPEVGRYKPKNEEVDLYDTILSHLIDEGYADTIESAERIMVNMSEDWRDSIVEARVDAGKTDDQKIDARNRRRDGDEYVDSAKFSPLPGVRGDSESDREIDHLSSRGKKKPIASSPTRQTKR